MKLSTYAKKTGICYKTAWNWYKAGRIQGYQSETGTILVTEDDHGKPMTTNADVIAELTTIQRKIEHIIKILSDPHDQEA